MEEKQMKKKLLVLNCLTNHTNQNMICQKIVYFIYLIETILMTTIILKILQAYMEKLIAIEYDLFLSTFSCIFAKSL